MNAVSREGGWYAEAGRERTMATIRFEEVKIKGVRRWKENGKARQETRTFMQTINPFNKNAAGLVKSRCEILQELYAERAQWLVKEVYHEV
jgi:hypothetical protein